MKLTMFKTGNALVTDCYNTCFVTEDNEQYFMVDGGDGIQLSLSLVSSPKARRHHMDLFSEDQQQEVERLLNLGASRKQWNYPKDADDVVLQDPDGNPFCVVQI